MRVDPTKLKRPHAVQGLLLGGARQPDTRHQGKATEMILPEPQGKHAVQGLLLGGPR